MSASHEVSRRSFLRHTPIGTPGLGAPCVVLASALGKNATPPALKMPTFTSLLSACLLLCSCLLAAAAELPGPVVPDGLGVNIHFIDPQPGEMEMLAQAGFRWIRMDFIWGLTEPQKGIYDFAAYDRLMATLETNHIRAVFILNSSNPHYNDGLSPVSAETTDEMRKAFARWAVAAVHHFRNRGVLWEMYNEPPADPKPAYLAAQTLTRVLSGYRFQKRLPVGGLDDRGLDDGGLDDYVMRFTKGNEVCLVAWTTAASHHTVVIPAPPGRYTATGHTGQILPALVAEKKGLTVVLSDAPMYLVPELNSRP